MIGHAMPIQNTAFDASRLFADPVSWSACCSLRAALFTGNERDWRCTANPENTVSTSAEVTEVEVGVETTADDQGNRTTLSLSPSRTPTEIGLDVSLDSQECAGLYSGLENLRH